MDELRRVLEHVYSCDVRSDALDKEKVITDALTALLSIMEKCVGGG
jgi:hypothetical protein